MAHQFKQKLLGFGAIVLLAIAACAVAADYATESQKPYTFRFDTYLDQANTSVIWYQLLSDSKVVAKRVPSETRANGLRTESIFQKAPCPTKLRIGWRDLSDNHDYAADIDLRVLLTKNISNSILFVEPKGAQISIFLISRDPRPPNAKPLGPAEFDTKLVTQIYSK